MKFIEASELIGVVENNLSIYFDSNSIDETHLYPIIEDLVESLGVEAKDKTSVTLSVSNHKAQLPDDFASLILAVACTTYKFKMNPQKGITTYEKRICDIPKCKTRCDYGQDKKGLFQIYQRVEEEWYSHQDIEVLTVADHSSGCDACENPKSYDKYHMEIKGDTIHTQFESGSIYLEYRQNNESVLVPDYPEIREWIKAEITAAIFKRMWYVMDGDVYNRFQYAQQEAGIKKHNALSFWRRNKPQAFNSLRKELLRHSNKLARL